jgi:hypothetical protein
VRSAVEQTQFELNFPLLGFYILIAASTAIDMGRLDGLPQKGNMLNGAKQKQEAAGAAMGPAQGGP